MKKKWTIALNLFIGVASIAAWLYMAFFSNGADALTERGFSSLKLFTVLSNLFNGIICLIYSFRRIGGNKETKAGQIWKLTGASCVGLTFVTVVGFLGPNFGYDQMFTGANFWLHLILPVATIFSFLFMDYGPVLSFIDTLFAPVPTALYAIGYVANVLINGVGTWPDQRNDFYGFFTWGNGMAAVIAVVLVLITWLIAIGLHFLRRARIRSGRRDAAN